MMINQKNLPGLMPKLYPHSDHPFSSFTMVSQCSILLPVTYSSFSSSRMRSSLSLACSAKDRRVSVPFAPRSLASFLFFRFRIAPWRKMPFSDRSRRRWWKRNRTSRECCRTSPCLTRQRPTSLIMRYSAGYPSGPVNTSKTSRISVIRL